MAADIVLWMMALLVAAVILGLHFAVALALTSVLGIWLMLGNFNIAVSMLAQVSYEAIRSQTFIVIPLFMLMGEFVVRSGAAADLYQVCNTALRRLPGRLAVATVAGSAVLGMLIPPSILLIVWAILTEMSVGALFLAGVVPGILLALLFAAYCVGLAIINPAAAPSPPDLGPGPRYARRELLGALGILGLVGVVIGGLGGACSTRPRPRASAPSRR